VPVEEANRSDSMPIRCRILKNRLVAEPMSPTGSAPTTAEFASRTIRKINGRLVPFFLVLYTIAYLDRANLSYASLEMPKELHFSNTVYGFGSDESRPSFSPSLKTSLLERMNCGSALSRCNMLTPWTRAHTTRASSAGSP